MSDQVSPEAVEAALGLNTVTARAAKRYFSPNRYEGFVQSLLQAALPALREQLEAGVRERLDRRIRRYRSEAAIQEEKGDIEEAVRLERAANVVGSILHELAAAFPPPPEEQGERAQ